LQVDLIPASLKDIKDPHNWEQSCAAGDFDAHATQLGTSLVAAGLQNSVIRLGAEMNGNWEADFVGTTTVEQRLWVRCFENEVVSLRHAAGEHFLIDWNPNPCQFNVAYSKLYPGNSYVDIMGLDLFDVSCAAPKTPYSFTRLANEPAGLLSIEAFAKAHHKPLSLPEWGLATSPSGDDPNFIDGIGSAFDSKNFAFETYFDVRGIGGEALPLGPGTPLSVTAFQRWFSNSVKP
jgi:beta-mannanase